MAVVALACGISCISVAFVGASMRAEHLHQVELRKPRPTPQMMAPDRKPPINSNGMIYAVGTTYVDGRGGY